MPRLMRGVGLVAAILSAGPLSAQGVPVRLAVLPFENTGSYGQDKEVFEALGLGLPELLAGALDRHPRAASVDRERVAEAMRARNLGPAQRIDAATATQLGNAVGARYTITGSFADFYGKFRVNARLVDTGTGQILTVLSVDDPALQDRAQMAAIIQALAGKIVEAAGLPAYPSDAATPAIPTDAITLYSQGLLYENRGDRAKAADFYQRALAAFPGYAEARAGLQRVRGG